MCYDLFILLFLVNSYLKVVVQPWMERIPIKKIAISLSQEVGQNKKDRLWVRETPTLEVIFVALCGSFRRAAPKLRIIYYKHTKQRSNDFFTCVVFLSHRGWRLTKKKKKRKKIKEKIAPQILCLFNTVKHAAI